MRKLIFVTFFSFLGFQFSVSAQKIKLKTSYDTLSYAIGVLMGSSFDDPSLQGVKNNIKPDVLSAGFMQSATKDGTQLSIEDASAYFERFMQTYIEKTNADQIAKNEQFLADNKKNQDIRVTSSGLQYKVIKEGDGKNKPTASSRVLVKYRGTLIDGTQFDKSDEGMSLLLNEVIPGFSEGLQLMSTGSKYMLYIPSEIGYGDYGRGDPLKPYSTLIFEVELISIENNNYDEEVTSGVAEKIVGDYKRISIHPSAIRFTDGEEVKYSYAYKDMYVLFFKGDFIILDAAKKEVCRMETPYTGEDGLSVVFYEPVSGDGFPLFVGVALANELSSSGAFFYVLEKGRCVGPKELDLIVEDYSGNISNPVEAVYFTKRIDGIHIMFEGSSILYNPNGQSTQVSTKDFHYVYTRNQWLESGAATQLSYFKRLQLIDELLKKKPYSIIQYAFGDMDNDGQEDLVYINKDDNKLMLCLCKDYKIVKTVSLSISNSYELAFENQDIQDGRIQIYEYLKSKDGEDYKSRTFLYRNNRLEEEK